MNLCIDIGNSRIKAGLFGQGKLLRTWTAETAQRAALLTEIPLEEIANCIISSTIELDGEFLERLRSIPRCLILDEHTRMPFINRYQTPATLGKDRLALVAAATGLYPGRNVLVIGCGTCITFNFKDTRENFLGGSIHPGLKMRLQAMHRFTGQLPLAELKRPDSWLAANTPASLQSGAIYGTAREIDGMIGEYALNYEDLTVLITGGDSEMLVSLLKNKIFALPDLTLAGLHLILESND